MHACARANVKTLRPTFQLSNLGAVDGGLYRVVVEPWGLGFLVVLTLTVTLTQTLITTQPLNDHN